MGNNKLQFERVKHEHLRIGDLAPHPRVQRAQLDHKFVARIAADFDPDKLGELHVVRAPESAAPVLYWIFDGQHRHAAAALFTELTQRVPCVIHDNLDLREQADLFLGLNDRKALTAYDKWRQRINAKEAKVLQIEKALQSRNLKTGQAPASGTIQAVAALERVYDHGEEVFGKTLDIIQSAWKEHSDAFSSQYLRGIGNLVARFNGQLDAEELSYKMQKEGAPGRVLGAARDYSKAVKCSLERAIVVRLLAIYNRKKTKGRLELE